MSATFRLLHIIPKERRGPDRVDRPNEDNPSGAITVTAFKLMAAIILYTTTVVGGMTFIFTSIMESKLENKMSAMALLYASKQESVPRAEYEIRRGESQEDVKRANDRVRDLEQRLTEHISRMEARNPAAR